MLSLLTLALPLALAGSAIANPLMQRGDACLAAVTGSAALGDASLRKSHCSSFIKTIVTPAAKTVTVTITGTPSPNSNGWNNWKRDVTVCPNEVPNYASACNDAGYKSACSAWGVWGDTTFTIPATTTTKTVYLGNGNGGSGGFGGQGGVCTSTNVITATTTVSACSGGTTTSTVLSTTTSVSTATSTVTVGAAPSITFTTTTTTSVGTVTSTSTSTFTIYVGPGSVSTVTSTSTTTADLTTTATSTTTVTVGASTTATSTTTMTIATTMTETDTTTTTVTDPGATTTQTLAVTVTAAGNSTTMTTTVTVNGSTDPSGSPSTPSSGNCLNAAQAQKFVDAFTDLLEYTSYNGTSAPPGRGYHYNVSATYLAADFQDYSDSINWMAGFPLGGVTFGSRAAFDYGQGLLQPELTMTTLNVDFGCKTVHWRWSAFTSSYAHVTGINYFTITDDLTQIQTNFAEFNNANWIESFSPYNPSISCVVPGGLTKSSKRSSVARSY